MPDHRKCNNCNDMEILLDRTVEDLRTMETQLEELKENFLKLSLKMVKTMPFSFYKKKDAIMKSDG
jgi:hypothetical protein